MDEKKQILKEILSKAKDTENVDELKKQIMSVFDKIDPIEISFVEQDLMKEGITWRDIYKMCDVHFELVKDIIIPKKELRELPEGHPLQLLIWENTEILKDNEKLAVMFRVINEDKTAKSDILEYLDKLYVGLKKHYMKNQFLIFPYLEKRGVTAISRVLWMKEDMLLAKMKKLKEKILAKASNGEFPNELISEGNFVVNEIRDIVSREHNILYPTMYSLMSDGEWLAVLNEMDKFGFYKEPPQKGKWKPKETEPIYPYMLTREDLMKAKEKKDLPREALKLIEMAEPDDHKLVREGDIEFEYGYLNSEEIQAIFNSLPFEITYIDTEKRTRFFNNPEDMRLFARTKTILGRPVKLCHPPKSEELVDQVIEKLQNGEKRVDFWINFMGRTVYISFLPVKNKQGELKGILEVVQDITDIKNIKGEKRTLKED